MKKTRKAISLIQCIALIAMMLCTSTLVFNTVNATANPSLPNSYIDTTYSSPAGNTITVNSGGDLQAALNSAQRGDKIILQAGATFTGNFTLPNKTSGSGWIYIQSSAYSSLPAQGVRVAPSNAGNMPKIVTANTSPAISTAVSAHHYRFVGIEIASSNSGTSWTCYNIASIECGQTQLSQVPTDITFDRCYIHGTTTGNIRRGIAANGIRVAVVDSYISNCHEIGADSQAINAWNGPGPFKIVNNYLEGAGENVMFGGSDTSVANLVPSDIEIKNNYFFKPLSWKVGNPNYGGIHWSVKNILEFKNAQRAIVEGNVFENNWSDAQSGYSWVITPRNQDGGNPWAIVQDLTYKNNILKNVDNGVNILGYDSPNTSLQTNDVLIQDNLFYGIPGTFVQMLDSATNVTINHNTIFSNYRILTADGTTDTYFEFTNNIANRGTYGVLGSNCGEGNSTLNYYFPGVVFTKNALVGANSGIYPANNFFPAAMSNVGFVDYANGDYRLASTSAYKNAGTDGKDLGGDITAINAATLHSIDGINPVATPTPTPSPTPTPTSYTVSSISASRQQTGYEATKAIDGVTTAQDPENRWSGDSQFAYITLDLGASKTVGSVDIDWYNVLSQQTQFEIKLSADGVTFGNSVYIGKCAALQGYQNYAFTAQAARYVRIIGHYNTNLTYSQWVSITEARVKDGSNNVLAITSATANRQQTGYEASKAIDGITSGQNPDNRWSGDNIFAYITADLGSSKTVSSVDLNWYNAATQQTTFEIQTSTDGINFTRVYNGTSTTATGFQKCSFTAASARYVRILGKANNNSRFPEWISISELKIWQ